MAETLRCVASFAADSLKITFLMKSRISFFPSTMNESPFVYKILGKKKSKFKILKVVKIKIHDSSRPSAVCIILNKITNYQIIEYYTKFDRRHNSFKQLLDPPWIQLIGVKKKKS